MYLANWTDQGAKDTSNSVHRATTAMDQMESVGAKIYEVHWATGPYDLVFVAELPDDETAHAVTIALSRHGNIRVTAMRVFNRKEMLNIVEAVDGMATD